MIVKTIWVNDPENPQLGNRAREHSNPKQFLIFFLLTLNQWQTLRNNKNRKERNVLVEIRVKEGSIVLPEFFDPTPEERQIILVDAETLREAGNLIESCEFCNKELAEVPFDAVLDYVTGSDPSVTDYIWNSQQSVRAADVGFWRRR